MNLKIKNVNEIQRGDFVQKGSMLYLVDKLKDIGNDQFIINAFFATCIRKNCQQKLHNNYVDKFSFNKHDTEKRVHRIKGKEKEKLITRIINEYPDFNIEALTINKNELSENECIEYLKDKGYLIYKQF
jgi:hypothetical protein